MGTMRKKERKKRERMDDKMACYPQFIFTQSIFAVNHETWYEKKNITNTVGGPWIDDV